METVVEVSETGELVACSGAAKCGQHGCSLRAWKIRPSYDKSEFYCIFGGKNVLRMETVEEWSARLGGASATPRVVPVSGPGGSLGLAGDRVSESAAAQLSELEQARRECESLRAEVEVLRGRAAGAERARESERREAAKARDAERRMVEESVAKCGEIASKVTRLCDDIVARVEKLEAAHATFIERVAESEDILCERYRKHCALEKLVERLAEVVGEKGGVS